jgi:hypothetical protein
LQGRAAIFGYALSRDNRLEIINRKRQERTCGRPERAVVYVGIRREIVHTEGWVEAFEP